MIVPDATTPEDLADLVGHIDDQTLAVGAADFFGHLLAIRTKRFAPCDLGPIDPLIVPPALLVCGSRLAWPARRKAAAAAGITLIECDGCGRAPPDSPAYALGFGDREVAPATAVGVVTSMAAAIINQLRIQTILVEGGETAAELAEKLNWTRFAVAATAPMGIGALRPLSGPTPLVCVKPGSYPWPAEIWSAFARMDRSSS
jgi:hypothetical protein